MSTSPVTIRITAAPGQPQYSRAVVYNQPDGTCRLEWLEHGYTGRVLVAEELVEVMAAEHNRVAELERALRMLTVACGRLVKTDGASDVLYGVLDARTHACSVLGLDPDPAVPA